MCLQWIELCMYTVYVLGHNCLLVGHSVTIPLVSSAHTRNCRMTLLEFYGVINLLTRGILGSLILFDVHVHVIHFRAQP